jgi:hypothetical protein
MVLIGATGFAAEHRLQKLWCDLAALRYADGVHDSLYLSAGRALLGAARRPNHRARATRVKLARDRRPSIAAGVQRSSSSSR